MREVIELNEHQMGNLNNKLNIYLSEDFQRDVTGLEIEEIVKVAERSYIVRYSYEYENGKHENGNVRWSLYRSIIFMKAIVQPKVLEDVEFDY